MPIVLFGETYSAPDPAIDERCPDLLEMLGSVVGLIKAPFLPRGDVGLSGSVT